MSDAPPPSPIRPRARFRWRRWLPRAALEAVLIVFSVTLALSVTNWAEERRTAARVGEMRQFVIQEVRINRDTLRDPYWLPHHERLSAALDRVIMLDNPTQADARGALDVMFETGVHIGATRDTVWRGLEASDLMSELDAKELFLLSDIYRMQRLLDDTNASLTASFGDILQGVESGDSVKLGIVRLNMSMNDIIGIERELIRRYDAALAELDPEGEARLRSAPAQPAAKRTDDAAPTKG